MLSPVSVTKTHVHLSRRGTLSARRSRDDTESKGTASSTAVLNFTYFDSARRDSVYSTAPRRKDLTAERVRTLDAGDKAGET